MDRDQKELSPLEIIRQDTGMTQEEFAVKANIPLATYRRMILKKPSEFKISLEQIMNVCRLSNITLDEFFSRLGFDVNELKKNNQSQRIHHRERESQS